MEGLRKMDSKPRFEYRERGFWDLVDFDDNWSSEGIYFTLRECPKHGRSRVLGFPFDSGCGYIEICVDCLQEIIALTIEVFDLVSIISY